MAAKTAVGVDVGRRLRELRERAGIPKERVALALVMSAGNWAHYESGRNQLAAWMLPTLADLYGMTLAELVSDLFEPRPPGHTVASSDNESHNEISANYNYTECRRGLSRPEMSSRQLVAACR